MQTLATQINQIMSCFVSPTLMSSGSAILVSPPVSSATPVHWLEPQEPPIEKYDGTLETCHSFESLLITCRGTIVPYLFATEHSKVVFIIINLSGRAHGPLVSSSICDSVVAFSAALGCVFGQLILGHEVACALGTLRQHNHHVFDHAIWFCRLTAESQWNNEALANTFFLSQGQALHYWSSYEFRSPGGIRSRLTTCRNENYYMSHMRMEPDFDTSSSSILCHHLYYPCWLEPVKVSWTKT